MEGTDQIPSLVESSSPSRNEGVPGAESTSTSASASQSSEENHDHDVEDNINQFTQNLAERQPNASRADEPVGDDTRSCVVLLLTFWIFVSMTLILGVYGSVNLQLGPNSSILIKTNALLVDYVKVKRLDDTSSGQMLYGFTEDPQLNVVTNWSQLPKISLSAGSDKVWPYYFNSGSEIKISYRLKCSCSSSLILVIAEGDYDVDHWVKDPSYPNTTLSWNIIQGNGLIQQDIEKSSTYYVAVANLNTERVEVQLNLTFRSVVYNTTEAYSKCRFTHHVCRFNLIFPNGNSAVLTTPALKEGTSKDEWDFDISYAPRWIVYFMCIGGLTLVSALGYPYFYSSGNRVRVAESERTPLLSQKDENGGSSYDSMVSQSEDNPGDGDSSVCAICFDALRDSFFLPCGHSVSCFPCGTRIAEAAGNCPVCRRIMKKVKKIYTV